MRKTVKTKWKKLLSFMLMVMMVFSMAVPSYAYSFPVPSKTEQTVEASDFAYDGFSVKLSADTLKADKDKLKLSGDISADISLEKTGTVAADSIALEGEFSIPEGIVIPELKVAGNSIVGVDGNEYFTADRGIEFRNITFVNRNLKFTASASELDGKSITIHGDAFSIRDTFSGAGTISGNFDCHVIHDGEDNIDLSASAIIHVSSNEVAQQDESSTGQQEQDQQNGNSTQAGNASNGIMPLALKDVEGAKVYGQDPFDFYAGSSLIHHGHVQKVGAAFSAIESKRDGVGTAYITKATAFSDKSWFDMYNCGQIFYQAGGKQYKQRVDIRVYMWSDNATDGCAVQDSGKVSAASKHTSGTNEGANTKIHLRYYFYKAGTLQGGANEDNRIKNSFNCVFGLNDLDENEGYKITDSVAWYYVPKTNSLKMNDAGTWIYGTKTSTTESDAEAKAKTMYFDFLSNGNGTIDLVYDCKNQFTSSMQTDPVTITYKLLGSLPYGYSSSKQLMPINFNYNVTNVAEMTDNINVARYTDTTSSGGGMLWNHLDRPGYTFTGWTTAQANGSPSGSVYTGATLMNSDITVYGKYVEQVGNLTITKNVVNGSKYGAKTANGFTFNLSGTATSGKPVNLSATTNARGIATFSNVPVGTYTLTETNAPHGTAAWKHSNATIAITNGHTESIIFTNEFQEGKARIVKTVTDPSGNITSPAGFKFTLTGTFDGTPVSESGTTDASGNLLIDHLPPGTYTVTEVGTPDMPAGTSGVPIWWDVHPTSGSVTVPAGGEGRIDFNNIYKTGNVHLVKSFTDLSGTITSKAGFKFRLHGTSTSGVAVDKTGTTDANGVIDFNYIPIGTYTLTEIGTPDSPNSIPSWWDCLNISQTVTVSYGLTTPVTANNIYKTGNVALTKTIEEHNNDKYNKEDEIRYQDSKAGFGFRLYGTSTSGVPVDKYAVTDAEGKLTFAHVPIGTYTVCEISSAEMAAAAASNASARDVQSKCTQHLKQYVRKDPKQVTVTYNDATHSENTTTIDFHNILVKWRITLTKEDREADIKKTAQGNATLEGAVYGLYDGNNHDKLIDKYTTDANGSFQTSYYALGDHWYFKEISASRGYLIDPNKYPVDASMDNITSRVEFNEAYLNNKTQDAGDSNTVYEQVQKGQIKYYKIKGDTKETDKEFLAGAGFSIYLLSDLEKEYHVDFSTMSDGEVVQWFFDNTRNESKQSYESLIGKKTASVYAENNDADVLSGALTKSLSWSTGASYTGSLQTKEYLVNELKTGEDGVLLTPRIPFGRYIIVETTVPKGYIAAAPKVITIDHDDHDDTVEGDGHGTPYKDLVIWDGDVTAYIKITKGDATTKKDVVAEGAQYVIHDVDGAYFKWYMEDRNTTDRNKYKSDFGDLVVDKASNNKGSYRNPYTTEIMYDADGNVLGTYIRTVKELPAGTYVLEEVHAPDGYIRQGKEGIYRTKDGKTFYEVESAEAEKWNQYHQAMNPDMTGTWAVNTAKAAESARVRVEINNNTCLYDNEISAFVYDATQWNDPAVGKLSVYAEGEFLTGGSKTGGTILDRLKDWIEHFLGYVTGDIGQTEDLSAYNNYTFDYAYQPIKGSTYVVKAAEDIVVNGIRHYAAGDIVTTLTTDDSGHAFTEKLRTNAGYDYYGLPVGKYTVQQTVAGNGFALTEENAAPHPFEITYDGEEVPIVFRDAAFKNPRQMVDLSLTKYDYETHEPVNGAVFGLYTKKALTNRAGAEVIPANTLVSIAETRDDGIATFVNGYTVDGKTFSKDGLPLGEYYAKELKAPKGYASTDRVVEIPAVYDSSQALRIKFASSAYDDAYCFVNEQTKLQINLMDYNTEVELDGAKITVQDMDTGEIFTTVITVHNGNPFIRKLEINKTYRVVEVQPRSGYVYNILDKEGYVSPHVATGYEINGLHFAGESLALSNITDNQAEFTVKDQGGVQILNLFNKPVKADIEVTKSGEVADTTIINGVLKNLRYFVKGLPNTKYDLVAVDDILHPDGYSDVIHHAGDKIAELTTDETGTATVTNLDLGKYKLVETKAPTGYSRDLNDCTKEADILAYYVKNFFDKGIYDRSTFKFDVAFENPRQIVDIGNPSPGPDPTPEGPAKEEVTPGATAPVYAGDDITYTISWNNTSDSAENIIIRDPLDKGVNYKSSDNNGAYDKDSHTVTWNLGPVAAGASGKVKLTVTVNDTAATAGKVQNKATVQVGNGAAVETEIVTNPAPGPDDPVKTEVTPGAGKLVKANEQITYEVKVKNTEGQTADVSIDDTLDKNLEFVSADHEDNVSYNPANRTITWNFSDVPNGETITVRFTVNVISVPVGDKVVNQAGVTFSDPHPEDGSSWSKHKETNEIENPLPEENDPTDPNKELYGHTGVYKVGVDGDNETFVEGAEFTLYAADDIVDVFGNVSIPAGTEIETAVSGKDGRAAFTSDLPVGRYVVRETAHPYGYYSTDTEVYFDTEAYENNDIVQYIRMNGTVKNAITETHVLLKDDMTLNELAGAQLKVEDPDGNVFTTWVTEDTDGEGYVIKGLNTDTKYTIVEVIPRDGYTNTVIVPRSMNSVLTSEDRNSASFTIHDRVVHENLDNVPDPLVLEIQNAFITGNAGLTKDGEMLTDVTQSIEEKSFLDRIIDWVQSVFHYEPKRLEGVEFTMYAAEDIYHPDGKTGLLFSEGDVVKMMVRESDPLEAVVTTDGNGEAIFEGLYLGHYTIEETSIPEGYAANNDTYPITVAQKDYETQVVDAQEGILDIVNIRQKIEISVIKNDEDDPDKVLSGAVFGLYTKDEIKTESGTVLLPKNTLVETEVTDENGKAVFNSDIPHGQYFIAELSAPKGYTSSYETVDIDASYDVDSNELLTKEIVFSNEITKIDVEKYASDTKELLEGAELSVLDATGETVDSWITDGSVHRIEGLEVGHTYTLHEVHPAVGYVTADDVAFTVEDRAADGTYEPQVVKMTDEPTKVEIQVWEDRPEGEDDIPLSGVQAHLEDMNGNIVVVQDKEAKWTSDATDPAFWERVPIGEYRIVVDSVPAGYVIPDPVDIEVKDTPELQHFDVYVPPIQIEIQVWEDRPEGEEDIPLGDVKAHLEDPEGNIVVVQGKDAQWTSDPTDPEFWEKVPAGNYKIVVDEVPAGYVTPDPVDIEVKETPELQHYDVYVPPIVIDITAVDKETGEPVSDVVVDVYDMDGHIVARNVTLEYVREHMPAGDYIIHVNHVPDGYLMPEDQQITVLETSEIQHFVVELEKAPEEDAPYEEEPEEPDAPFTETETKTPVEKVKQVVHEISVRTGDAFMPGIVLIGCAAAAGIAAACVLKKKKRA